MNEDEEKILNRIEELIHKGKLSESFQVANLQLMVNYLGLERVSKTASREKKTSFGIRKTRRIIKICDYQLTINNE